MNHEVVEIIEKGVPTILSTIMKIWEGTKNWLSSRNIKIVEKIVTDSGLVQKIENISKKDKNKSLEVTAKIAQYLFMIHLEPTLEKKIPIVKYDLNQFLSNVEHISFVNSITSVDLLVFLNFPKKLNTVRSNIYDRILNNVGELFDGECSKDNFLEKLNLQLKGIFDSNAYLNEKYYFLENNMAIGISFELMQDNGKDIEFIFDKHEIFEKIKFDGSVDKFNIIYKNVSKPKEEEQEEMLIRLENVGLIKRASYGATFGPANKEYIAITKKGRTFLEFIKNNN